jgi:hypothetical protein
MAGGEVTVGQHDHPGVQGAEQIVGVAGLPDPVGAEGGVDDGAGATRHQGQDPGQRVAGAALVAATALVDPQVRRGVRTAQDGAVDRADQPPAPPHALDRHTGGRPAEQVEQRPQRRDPDPTPRLGQPTRARHGHLEPVQAGDHPGPHLAVAQIGEQRAGQQQIDHDPRGQIPHPLLLRSGLSHRGIDHLEGHDPGQLTDMTGREPPTGHGDHTPDDRIRAQRSSRWRRGCLGGRPLPTGAPLP